MLRNLWNILLQEPGKEVRSLACLGHLPVARRKIDHIRIINPRGGRWRSWEHQSTLVAWSPSPSRQVILLQAYLRLPSYAHISLIYLVARTGEDLVVELKIHIRNPNALNPYLRLSSDAEKFLRHLVGFRTQRLKCKAWDSNTDMSLTYLETIGDILIVELRIQLRKTDALETYLRISILVCWDFFLQSLLVGKNRGSSHCRASDSYTRK